MCKSRLHTEKIRIAIIAMTVLFLLTGCGTDASQPAIEIEECDSTGISANVKDMENIVSLETWEPICYPMKFCNS